MALEYNSGIDFKNTISAVRGGRTDKRSLGRLRLAKVLCSPWFPGNEFSLGIVNIPHANSHVKSTEHSGHWR